MPFDERNRRGNPSILLLREDSKSQGVQEEPGQATFKKIDYAIMVRSSSSTDNATLINLVVLMDGLPCTITGRHGQNV